MAGQAPVLVVNQNVKRETGRKAQLGNITAAKTVASIVRSTLGPRSMLKMLLDPMGGVVMTNDGNAILREVDVGHPSAKSMIELSRAQDEEVGDGTTSVIVLAGEVLHAASPFVTGRMEMHPTVIVSAYHEAQTVALKRLEEISREVDVSDRAEMRRIVQSCIGTKFVSRWGDLMCDIALDAVMRVRKEEKGGQTEIDIKRYAKVEKLPGGDLEESRVLNGVMFNKDVTHPRMRRRIENPRVLLMDCPLEYKKSESQANVEIEKEEDWDELLRQEEEYIKNMCNHLIALKPDIIITEKGVSDLAQHYFVKNNITSLRRLRKTDNLRVARVTGATICHRPDEITEDDIGTNCGLYEVRKIGDEYFSFMEDCTDATACSIMLRGASKDVLNEVERNLHDAMLVARNIVLNPRLVPGGGAAEMCMSAAIRAHGVTLKGAKQYPTEALAHALEVIPRTLADNCGAQVVRLMTELRAKHAAAFKKGEICTIGVEGDKGELIDMHELGIWEPLVVKEQTFKTAMESAIMLLRIDDIVSGSKSDAVKAEEQREAQKQAMEDEKASMME